MYQVPMEIWNQIAKTQKMESPVMKSLFSMTEEKMTAELDNQAQVLQQQGISPTLIAAIQLVLPLLVENQAISRFIQETNQRQLRMALPELLTVDEALVISRGEYNLTNLQVTQLKDYLNKSVTALLG